MKSKDLAKLNVHRKVCKGGPFSGYVLRLSVDGNTFVFTAHGQTGYYQNGVWHAVSQY